MNVNYSYLFFLATFVVFNLVDSTEFVPCFMWSNKRTNERVPALNKISQDTFEEGIQEHLRKNTLIVVFEEPTLSPEDFAQRDQAGVIFPNLLKLAKSSEILYLPYVQNPIKALKHLDATVMEVPLEEMREGTEIAETDILIVSLNDALDSENRIAMLKRHDKEIASIYQNLPKTRDVLAILTAQHPSWVASEEIVESRQARSLLQAVENPPKDSKAETSLASPLTPVGDSFYNGTDVFLYVNNFTYVYEKTTYNATDLKFDIEADNGTYTLNTVATGLNHTVTMKWIFSTTRSTGYWELEPRVSATIMNSTLAKKEMNLTSGAPLIAPQNFSFHCGDQVFADNDFKVTLKNFQIEIFSARSPNKTKFDDAYDCVGFTSVPIWSGLFVTTILLIIMTLGITMMMDIRTMDRFDDAKGKTITINAE